MAAPYTALLARLSPERFAALLAPLNRQNKERYFARHGVRAPKAAGGALVRPGHKNEVRAALLQQALQQRPDEPLAEELLRSYLVQRRPMLEAALDFVGVPHEGGLTDSPELDKLGKLSLGGRKELVSHLLAAKVAEPDEVELYLDFMALQGRAAA